MNPKNRIYELFPDRALVGLKAGVAAVSMAEKTARNMLTEGTFPIQTVLVGRKRLVVVADLARYYSELVGLDEQPAPTPEPTPGPVTSDAPRPPRPRGRPRKCAPAGKGGAQ